MKTAFLNEKHHDFFEQVYQVVRLVPKGRVTTYGAIARCLGTGGSARMVGWAMNASHTQEIPVPAHRVVNRNGALTGKMHFEHPRAMEDLLMKEGVIVEDDKVREFKALFWDPQSNISW